MTPQELKNSILQLAIQGKLVEQRPEDGDSTNLVHTLKTIKNSLIEAKAIRVPRKQSVINRPEEPFEIPEKWTWVTVSDCISIRSGLAYTKGNLEEKAEKMVRVLRGGNILDMSYTVKTDDVMIAEEYVKPDLFLRMNAIITPAVTSIDHIGKMGRIEKDYDDMVAGGFVLVLTPHLEDDVFSKYLLCAFSSKFFRDCCRGIANKSGQAFYNLSREKMMQLIVPLPPLTEQRRIVAKIEELLPYIDRYEKAWNRLEDFNKRFPGDMQKSILQMAIQGKLVEQRPEEGTGEELYQQIQAEKQELIQAKKIKKGKALPEITEDEVPFEIPETWKWVRIGQIFNLQAGKNIKSEEINQERSSHNPYPCYGGNGIRGYVKGYNRKGNFAIMGRQGALCGNINFAFGEFYATEHAVVIEQFAGTNVAWCGHFLKALNLNQYSTATAQPGLSVAKINMVLLPLPPLAEQKRIVARLEELLPLCERLK